MIQIPFSRDRFADEAKSRISGINTTLEFDNIESGLLKAAHLVADTIGEQTYSKIVRAYPGSGGRGFRIFATLLVALGSLRAINLFGRSDRQRWDHHEEK